MSMKTCLTSSMLLRWVTRIGSKRKMLTQRRSISLCLLINGLLKRWVSTQIHQSKQSQTFPSTTYCKIHTTLACLTTSLRISPTETTSSLIAIAMKTTIIIRATWSTSCLTWHIWRKDSRIANEDNILYSDNSDITEQQQTTAACWLAACCSCSAPAPCKERRIG